MACILLVDTATSLMTVAVGNGSELLHAEHFDERGKQAEEINVMVQRVLHSAGLDLSQIDAFGVCAGPGSYTGLRIGMSTLKGMAFAMNKPLLCFDRLRLIALSYRGEEPKAASRAVLLQARKGEYFFGSFSSEGRPLDKAVHIFEAGLDKAIRRESLLITDKEGLHFPNKAIFLPKKFSPNLKEWLALAQLFFEEKGFADVAYAEPFYLKAAFTTTPKKKL